MVFRFTPEAQDEGMRLDQFVAGRSTELSRSFLRRVVELGGVHVGGRRVRRSSHPVRTGEQIEVFLDGLPIDPWQLTAKDVLFHDKYLLAVNKPAGVETQPTPARFKGTLYEAALGYLQDPFRPRQKPSLGMVQRLDRGTSGVLTFSIHPRAHKGLANVFSGRRVVKTYLALVSGVCTQKTGEIRTQLARQRATNRMRSVARGGREAITRFRVRECFPESCLMEVQILTGRSHQIRVHLAELGHPLLGDTLYGGPDIWVGRSVPRQMLHAWRLFFAHPVTEQPLELEAPLPEDLAGMLAHLRGGSANR